MANAVATLSTFPPIAVSAGRPDAGKAREQGQARKDKPAPVLIVLGRDETDKPHASAFGEVDAALARKAAEIMGMHAIPVEADGLRALAARLPEGRVFASGKAFVPFVKASLFDELVPHLGEGWKEKAAVRPSGTGAAMSGKAATGSRNAGAGGAASNGADKVDGGDGASHGNAAAAGGDAGKEKGASASAPVPHDAKPAAPKHPTDWSRIGKGSEVLAHDGDAWYEAIVIEERAGQLVALRWRDYDEPDIVRRRDHLGLLHPDFKS